MIPNIKPMVDRFRTVCAETNPFIGAISDDYGFTADDFYNYFMTILPHTPVVNSPVAVTQQIREVMRANNDLYKRIYDALQSMDTTKPIDDSDYSDVAIKTGNDTFTKSGTTTNTNTRSGNDSNVSSGTDSTNYGRDTTHSENTYDNTTLQNIAKDENGGTDSVNYGKTDTLNYGSTFENVEKFSNRADTTEYNTTTSRTISGRTGNPSENAQKRIDVSRRNRLFLMMIDDFLKAISCVILPPASLYVDLDNMDFNSMYPTSALYDKK